MTQHFKIQKNGNIKGLCPKTGKTIHNLVCKACNDCLSFNAPLGIPTLIICKGGGIEGYTYSPQGEKTKTTQEKRRYGRKYYWKKKKKQRKEVKSHCHKKKKKK